MFGPPGRLYVYFTYGMHFCMNVVTGADGEGSAVLLRAVEPLDGMDRMAEHRGLHAPRLLAAGPGRLCQAFAVGREHNGIDLVSGTEMWIEPGDEVSEEEVRVGPRVGIRQAVEEPWRFVVAGSPFVSRARAGPRGARRPPRATG
jgi:DNA-3-methyladenine glycosylase